MRTWRYKITATNLSNYVQLVQHLIYSEVWLYTNCRGNVNQVGDSMTFLLRLIIHL
jgi:hypothetical protein